MGRSPCCDKVGLKKGPWTPEEDQKLLSYIEEHGHGSWRALPGKAGLQRCGKSCRLRWTNYLRPDIKRGKFSIQEEQIIIQLHALLGNRWSAIATHLPKRTDNEIKNYWNTHLKKHLTKLGIDPVTHKPKSDTLSTAADGHSRTAANLNHMAQWESARLEAEARLVRESKLRPTPQPATCPHIALSSSPSLEALRSWQCVWSKPDVDHESPTSTLSFSENNILNQNIMISSTMETTEEDDEGNNWIKCYKKEAGISFSLDETTAIFSSEEATSWLAGMMIGGGPDEQNSSDNAGGSCVDVEDGDGDGGGGEEENKDYWNSILNLVNSTSPPNSPPPVF